MLTGDVNSQHGGPSTREAEAGGLQVQGQS
jgi:hypothetical protein